MLRYEKAPRLQWRATAGHNPEGQSLQGITERKRRRTAHVEFERLSNLVGGTDIRVLRGAHHDSRGGEHQGEEKDEEGLRHV